ncbi:retrotrans_gag domain-containing protein [Trichonephila clavipes]|nr:retrotrans_gag domain-containing protein [Trichonephila clavipes]
MRSNRRSEGKSETIEGRDRNGPSRPTLKVASSCTDRQSVIKCESLSKNFKISPALWIEMRSLRLRGLSPEFGLLKENSRKRTKMPTEQEAKPAVVTPSLQQWRSPSTFRGAPGEDPLKWLKEYDRVANFNKWMT